MNIESRQRSIGEYLEMLWRHKLAILLPTIAVGLAVGYVVLKLPNIYESKTLLKINPPTISNEAVKSLTDIDVSQRLNSITEEIKSRGSLEPLITKFGLFERERAGGTPMELLVEQMRRNIDVQIIEGKDERATNFTVAYKDREPDKARAVAAELAGKYIKSQQDTLIRSSRETRDFFEKQLNEVKVKLDEIDKRRLTFMSANLESLPVSAPGLIAQLEGLREQEKTLETEIGRMRDQRGYIEREKNNIREYGDKENVRQQTILNDIKRTPVYAEMIKKRSDLQAQLKNLLSQYREAHPDVIAKKNEIEQVNKEIASLEEQTKTTNEELTKSTTNSIDLRIKASENDQLRIDSEIARQTKVLDQVRVEIGDLTRRINSVPTANVALETFDREYQTLKLSYDDLLKKKNEADLEAGRNLESKGESISIVDPAGTPQAPVNASKRYMLIGVGIFIGLALGLMFAFLLEFPRLLTINTVDDAKHYTHLPVLAAVPELVTAREARWQRGMNFFKVMTGMAATAVSVPILIIVLQISHVFDRFAS